MGLRGHRVAGMTKLPIAWLFSTYALINDHVRAGQCADKRAGLTHTEIWNGPAGVLPAPWRTMH